MLRENALYGVAADVMAEFADAGCSDSDIDQIGWQNSCRFFGIDVADVDRNEVSVGALQKKGADVDTSLVSRNEWRERYELAAQSPP